MFSQLMPINNCILIASAQKNLSGLLRLAYVMGSVVC